MYKNFSIWQNRSSSISLLYKGISSSFGKIAFDYVSNNIYWCDPFLQWIAMKPAYNLNNTIYKVILRKDLNNPEGLALDPVDRYFLIINQNHYRKIAMSQTILMKILYILCACFLTFIFCTKINVLFGQWSKSTN